MFPLILHYIYLFFLIFSYYLLSFIFLLIFSIIILFFEVFQQYEFENFVPFRAMLVFQILILKCLFLKSVIDHKHQAIPYILNSRIGAGSAVFGFLKWMNKPAEFHPKKMFLGWNL